MRGSIFKSVYINGKRIEFNSDYSIQAGFCFVFAVFGRNGFLFCLLKSVKWHWFRSSSFYASIPVSVQVMQYFALLYAALLSRELESSNQLVINQAYLIFDGGTIFPKGCFCCLSFAELWAQTNHMQECALTINNGNQ